MHHLHGTPMSIAAHDAKGAPVNSFLRMVVVGRGNTRGRRSHLVRLREGLVQDLQEVAQGPMYLLIERAVQGLIDELRARNQGIEVIQATDFDANERDVRLVEQIVERARKADEAAAQASQG